MTLFLIYLADISNPLRATLATGSLILSLISVWTDNLKKYLWIAGTLLILAALIPSSEACKELLNAL